MAVFNAAKREIDIKIVYYGPALCGKTTNVQMIHKKMSPQQRGDIMSLATKDDRTLFFDFLPIELGNVKGFKTRFHLYTVPGQVYYALTRRAVLTSVDGVVFVADSQQGKMDENIESLKDLDDNLKFHKKGLETVPFVIQYNKRDMDDLIPVSELEAALNTYNVPAFEASAVKGNGVMEALTACCKLVLKQLNKPAGAREEKPAAAAAPEPDIKLTDEVPAEKPVAAVSSESAVDAVPEDVPRFDTEAAVPTLDDAGEPRTTEMPGAGVLELSDDDGIPEIEIDSSSLSVDAEPDSFVPDTDIADAEIPAATFASSDDGISVLSCGDPQKISETAIKVPLKFKLEEGKVGSVTVTINFDDFKLD